MRMKIEVSLIALTLITLLSCGGGTRRNDPDVSDVEVNLRLLRFDQDLFALDTARLDDGVEALAAKYPDFLPFFVTEVAGDPTNREETPREAITGFVTAPQVRRLYDSCQVAYGDIRWLEADLTDMFRYYRHYFPDKQPPRVVTAVTEFVGDAYMVNDSLLMLGLDMFLGEDFSGYNPDYFPKYLRRQFSREFITTKAALALTTRLVGPPSGERVVDHMINNGKILYIMDLMLPTVPDSTKMGYTAAQMEGCYANEQNVWARLLDMNVLYEPLGMGNQKIVNPSPSADNVFQEAPGEVGNWIGWQMVKAYAKRHPEATLADIIRLKDTQTFMEEARYKPKRN
jgi:hypothetical protein